MVAAVPWLKRMNARGSDIHVRPVDGPELLLIRPLQASHLEAMRLRGLEPAAIIEASPGQFQAWLKLAEQRLLDEKREMLIRTFSGRDADLHGYGRLAGFTNQHIDPDALGRQPYVLAHKTTGKIAPGAEKLLDVVAERMRNEKLELQRIAHLQPADRSRQRHLGRSH